MKVTDEMIRAACNAYGASQGSSEWDWMRDALEAALRVGRPDQIDDESSGYEPVGLAALQRNR